MKPASLLLLWLSLGAVGPARAQGIRAFNDNVDNVLASEAGSYHDMFKVSLMYCIKKGLSVGATYGFWKETGALQYSLNTGFMYRFQRKFLGNYYNGAHTTDPRSRGQLVFMFSPMLTSSLGGPAYVYQELEPFYMGTPNAVFCRYKYSVTLGTTFTVSPRGTFNNIATARNRSQQEMMLAFNIKDFNLTIYDDYFSVFTQYLQLGDNWDRFFTGGGFVRYRVNHQLTLHLYSEVYTGINRAIPFLNPDIISYKPKRRFWRLKNYANQDPGQEFFNASWFVLEASYSSSQAVSNNAGVYTPEANIYVGSSAPWTMFSQRFIHSWIKYDTTNHLRFHYFLPRSSVPGNLEAGGRNDLSTNFKSLFVGAGLGYNIH